MKTSFITLLTAVSLFCAVTVHAAAPPTLDGSAATGTNKAPAVKGAGAKSTARPIPFRGSIKSVDKNAGALVIGTRTFSVPSTCKIMRSEKAAALSDAVVGEWVTGSYRKLEDGKLVATSLYLGGKTPQTKPAKK